MTKNNSRHSVAAKKQVNQITKPGAPSSNFDKSTRQPTETSDFMNRFKGKITTMNKDGHIGVVQKTSQPVNKMDYIGFQSGMSGASNITALPQKVAPPQ